MVSDRKPHKKVSAIFITGAVQDDFAGELEHIRDLFRKTGYSYEIILFHNGGSDKDFNRLEKLVSSLPDTVAIHQKTPLANGWAIKESLRYVSGEYVIFYDYNHRMSPENLKYLIRMFVQKNLDLVVGYKNDTERLFHYNWMHRMLRRSYFYFVGLLFGFVNKDIPPSVKIFKRHVLEDVLARIVAKSHVLGLELLVVANYLGYRIESLPMELQSSKEYRHHVSLRTIFNAVTETLGIYYRLRFLKYYEREQSLPHDYPPVSIIIPVKENNPYLEECVSACRQLDYTDYEIVVLPDERIDLHGKRVKIIPTGNITPPRKRDIGIESANGELIAFLDSDAFPVGSWLKCGVRYFGDEEVGAVCGPAMTPRSDNIWQRASGAIFSSFLVGGNCIFRYVPMPHREVEDYPSCNLLVRKTVLDEIGGFNTGLYPGDDTLLCFKIIEKAKKKIMYDPDVVVYHHRRSLFFKHFKQLASYAMHRGYFVWKFPRTSFKPAYFLPSVFIFGFFLIGVISVIYPSVKIYFLFVLGIYGVLAFLTALRTMDFRLIPLVFGGIIATHITYGLWFIKGLLSRKMPEE